METDRDLIERRARREGEQARRGEAERKPVHDEQGAQVSD
jgi:hypothetical protein